MELFDNLASFGLTSSVLQIMIIGGALLFLIGMFWKIILAGLGVAFCVAVFAMPSKKVDKAIETMTNAAPVIVPAETKQETKPDSSSLKPNEDIVEVTPEDTSEKGMFMTDCQKYGGYTASQCIALWNDRENDKVRYRKATNKMFMMKAKHNYRYDRT